MSSDFPFGIYGMWQARMLLIRVQFNTFSQLWQTTSWDFLHVIHAMWQARMLSTRQSTIPHSFPILASSKLRFRKRYIGTWQAGWRSCEWFVHVACHMTEVFNMLNIISDGDDIAKAIWPAFVHDASQSFDAFIAVCGWVWFVYIGVLALVMQPNMWLRHNVKENYVLDRF